MKEVVGALRLCDRLLSPVRGSLFSAYDSLRLIRFDVSNFFCHKPARIGVSPTDDTKRPRLKGRRIIK